MPSKGGMCRTAHLPQGSIGGHNEKVGFQISYDGTIAIIRAANGSSYWASVSWWGVPAAQQTTDACF